ncbi:MAG: hypothetical protein WEA54_00560 [Actinomycetota bacterium]
MAGEREWMAFEKAVEITVSAVRGAMTGQDGQDPRFAADVFREIHTAMKEVVDTLPQRGKTGFGG